MSRSNGRPEPEVIMNFSDGYSYSKSKLDAACFAILEHTPSQIKAAAALKDGKDGKDVKPPRKEDIDLIVNEFEIPRSRAEKALLENDKDVVKTMHALIGLGAQ
ncbi:hypothetical protein GYMLUDRAFT_42261 [Collybiopsis luxurians FD-317 M1]|uniref:Nascent polypeptide-associated complex subunit alpha-like UBA domain-containing protein n=1 Tax=Collybiopsis luxurians FD-317 M1 TaxID=944289 RepID=A0A0D0BDN4_9AGAR|nr:hypothetical protein GYMLUDRAFT_42261 [Collybiopsis luxurians FD-317 M1]